MSEKCFKCGSLKIVKNGVVFGLQRYKCKNCGYQYTKAAPAGKPIHIKMLAHNLYSAGMSMRQIAKVIGVTAQSVSRWINKWHQTYEKEVGSQQILSFVSSDKIGQYVDIAAENKCILLSSTLPSGAKVRIIVQLPDEVDLSL